MHSQAAFAKGHQAACSLYDCPPKTVTFPYKARRSTEMISYQLVDIGTGIHVYRSPHRSYGKGTESAPESPVPQCSFLRSASGADMMTISQDIRNLRPGSSFNAGQVNPEITFDQRVSFLGWDARCSTASA